MNFILSQTVDAVGARETASSIEGSSSGKEKAGIGSIFAFIIYFSNFEKLLSDEFSIFLNFFSIILRFEWIRTATKFDYFNSCKG